MIKRLRIVILYCKKCDSIIWSKYRHDFISCKCGESFIDGGGEYTRYGGNDKNIKLYEITLPQNSIIKTYAEYVEYVDAKIKLWKETDFVILKSAQKSKGYAKCKEVIEWIQKKIFKRYHIQK